MYDPRTVDAQITVAPQIRTEDLVTIRAAGFVAVINNRPDDEEPGQPTGAQIAAAAKAAGLAYTAIPITHSGFSANQVSAMHDAMTAADGPVLAYCRSGTRSCNLWALACAQGGDDPDAITGKAAGAGYDIGGIRPLLDQLAANAPSAGGGAHG